MVGAPEHFERPGAAERLFNRVLGVLVSLGLGPSYVFLLEVRGRRTGRTYSTPVDILVIDGRRYLVAPRGHTQWVRNAMASGSVTLRKGRRREELAVRPLSDEDKPPILQAYLGRFTTAVQGYFPVPAGAAVEAFRPLAPRYPAFELVPKR